MKLKIKLHPNSSQEKIEKISEYKYEIWIKDKPINNRANFELIKVLKKYFKRKVNIISGFSSRDKIVEIEWYSYISR